MRLFIHKEGLVRFATEDYEKPNKRNMKNTFMHLTNYAINKNNDKFIQAEDSMDDDTGHKWSLKAFYEYLKDEGKDVK